MRQLVCVSIAIGLLGFPTATFAQANDGNRKAAVTTSASGARVNCGRYTINLKSGEVLKNVKACWTVGEDQVRIVQNGTVRMVANSQIKQMRYIATFWEKFKDGARLVLLIPAIPVVMLLLYLDLPRGAWN